MGSIPTRGNEIFLNIYIFISSLWLQGKNPALSSATQHAMPSEFGGKWRRECLNTRFPYYSAYPVVCPSKRSDQLSHTFRAFGRFPKRRGFKSRYVQFFFSNKYFSFLSVEYHFINVKNIQSNCDFI